jgi:hypothetical protein
MGLALAFDLDARRCKQSWVPPPSSPGRLWDSTDGAFRGRTAQWRADNSAPDEGRPVSSFGRPVRLPTARIPPRSRRAIPACEDLHEDGLVEIATI